MNDKTFLNNKKTPNLVLRMQPRASKGNNLIELGLQHGKRRKNPQFPEYLHYIKSLNVCYT